MLRLIRSILLVAFPPLLFIPSAFSAARPIEYKITINPSDLSGYDVEMRFVTRAKAVRLAMAAHPEYDDKYWRYIEDFSAESRGKKLAVTRPEDAVWEVDGISGSVIVRYRLHLPAQTGPRRDAWKPFLTPTGGMVGDLHSLMYVVGADSAPARLMLDMPKDWAAASGLDPTADPKTFAAPVEIMLDAPVIIGKFREWKFTAGGVPHRIVVWAPPDAPDFDTGPLVSGIQKLAEQAVKTFGRPPYKRYAFLFQNGGDAALEHLTSVNIGHDFSRGVEGLFEEIAHEYFHAWNLMDVRPRERVGLQYKFAPPTGVLWWCEGATIMFADYLLRRMGQPFFDQPRTKRLETSIARYFSWPGYVTLSAEQASRGDTDPLSMGDYFASTHLQGELLATMLDLMIRDKTDGRRTVADVMVLLASGFDYRHGITNNDIERAVARVCPTCDVHGFFRDHIYGAKQIDFDRYLGLMGVRSEITRAPALGTDGKPSVDLRIGPMPGDLTSGFKIRITSPQSAWGRAGLHTGDRLVTADGSQVSSWRDLRAWLQKIKIGDTGRIEIIRDGVTRVLDVSITGYDVPTVRLTEIPNATPRQVKLRDAWISAN